MNECRDKVWYLKWKINDTHDNIIKMKHCPLHPFLSPHVSSHIKRLTFMFLSPIKKDKDLIKSFCFARFGSLNQEPTWPELWTDRWVPAGEIPQPQIWQVDHSSLDTNIKGVEVKQSVKHNSVCVSNLDHTETFTLKSVFPVDTEPNGAVKTTAVLRASTCSEGT